VLRKIAEGLHKTELAESKKELGHCIEEQEGCKKMLLELGTLAGQAVNKQELAGQGVNKQKLGDCRKVVLELPEVEEQEGYRKAVLGLRAVEEQVVNIQERKDCIQELED
jgi:hypothetical protein